MRYQICLVLTVAVLMLLAKSAPAQQIYVNTPFVTANDSFYEHYGIHWGFNRRWENGFMFFNNGGWNGALPPFGGFNPANNANFGFGGGGQNSNFFFNMTGGQGSQRSIVGVSPSLTLTNGVPGYIFSGEVRPFVVGWVPVVGGWGGAYPMGGFYQVPGAYSPGPVVGARTVHPAADRIARFKAGEGQANDPKEAHDDDAPVENARLKSREAGSQVTGFDLPSSAEHGDISLAEIRRRQREEDAQKDKEADVLEAKGMAAANDGKLEQAKLYYRQAADRAMGARRKELLRKAEL